jgi:hypothetical protein
MDWNAALDHGPCEGKGIYQISRVFGGYERLLYVGIVWSEMRSFYIRMNEHRRDWINNKNGVIYLRFGAIVRCEGVDEDRDLVEEAEGAIILNCQPVQNRMKKRSFSIRDHLVVRNTGNRGFIDAIIDTSKEFDLK